MKKLDLSSVVTIIIFLIPFISNYFIEDAAITNLLKKNVPEFEKRNRYITYANKGALVYMGIIFVVLRLLAYAVILIANYGDIKIYFNNIIITVGIVIGIGICISDIVRGESLLAPVLHGFLMSSVVLLESISYNKRIDEIRKYIMLEDNIKENINGYNVFSDSFTLTLICVFILVTVIMYIYLGKYFCQYQRERNNILVSIYTNEIECYEIPLSRMKSGIQWVNINNNDDSKVYVVPKDKIVLKEYRYVK